MASANYGVDLLTDEALLEILNVRYGNAAGLFQVEKKGNKYYIKMLKKGINVASPEFYNATDKSEFYEIADVISRSTTQEMAAKIIGEDISDHSRYAPENYYDKDTLSEYAEEAEHKLKTEIGHIRVNDDGTIDIYDLNGNAIIYGTTIKRNPESEFAKIEAHQLGSLPSEKENKFDLSDLEVEVREYATVDINDQLNADNKSIIEDYLKQITNSDVKLELQDGHYIANASGKVIVFDENVTLGKAVSKINETFVEKRSMMQKSLSTNKINQMAKYNQIFIDAPTFERIQSIFGDTEVLVNEGKGSYTTGDLKDKLAAAYNSLVSQSPVEDLNKVGELLAIINTNIDYSLQAYENIDHNLGVIINSIISEIFSINKYADEEDIDDYSRSTLEERMAQTNKIIEDLEAKLNKLQSDYNTKYHDGGVWRGKDVTTLLMGIGYAFGFVDKSKKEDGVLGNTDGVPISVFLNTMDFIEKNDLITVLKSYSSGASWKDSGLEEIYLKRTETHLTGLAEQNFLNAYVTFQRSDTLHVAGAGAYHMYNDYSVNDVKLIKSHMANQLTRLDSLIQPTYDLETGDEKTLYGFDALKYFADDILSDNEVINTTAQQLDGYKKYRDIMPFEADMQGDVYLQYLVQDWSKIDLNDDKYGALKDRIQYLSQSELALYFMYMNADIDNPVGKYSGNYLANSEKADKYLTAMSDLINQRHGLEDAVLRLKNYHEWQKPEGIGGDIWAFLNSGVDGISDGIDGFFRGIGNAFTADGIKDASDYRDLYFLSLLSGDVKDAGVDEVCKLLGIDDMDQDFNRLLKRNYAVFKSVGTMTIPTLASFIPGVGPALSKTLYALNTFGSATESAMAMQIAKNNQTDAARAYLYGGVSALSQVAMNKFSGIIGLNGKIEIPQGVMGFTAKMLMQSARTVTGMYTDAVLRAAILGQPVDLSGMDITEATLNGMLTAGIMNGVNIVGLKIADKFVYHFSDKYNNYAELMRGTDLLKDCKEQFYNSKLGKRLLMLKAIGSKTSQYDKTIVGKWLDEAGKDNEYGLMDLTESADSILGGDVHLKDGQYLVLDPKRKNYYIYDENVGGAITVQSNWLSMHEPGPIKSYIYGEFGLDQTMTWEEYKDNNHIWFNEAAAIDDLESTGTKIVGVTDSEHFIIKTPSGKLLEVTKDALFSQNLLEEMKLENSPSTLKVNNEPILVDKQSLIEDWLRDRVAEMSQDTKTDLGRSSEDIIDSQLDMMARRYNVSIEEMKTILAEKLKNLYNESDVGVRTSLSSLKKILEDGRIKNQLEPGTVSGGVNDPDLRRNFEKYFMGLENLDDQDHPVYGMLFPNKNTNSSEFEKYVRNGQGYWYGQGGHNSTEVVLLFDKNQTSDLSTMTLGDSLDYGRKNLSTWRDTVGIIQRPTSVNDPQFTGGYVASFRTIDELNNSSLTRFTENGSSGGYVEIQLYGSSTHDLSSLSEVVFMTKPSDTSMLDMLNSLYIPYTIMGE